MSDLLGDPAPETPPMDAPLPWAVFQITESEWYVARTLDEAKGTAADDMDMTVAECEADLFVDAHELTATEMETYMFVDDERPGAPKVPFRQALAERIAAGITGPAMFAAHDY